MGISNWYNSIGYHFSQPLGYSFVFIRHIITDLLCLNLKYPDLDLLDNLFGYLSLLLSVF